MKILIINPGGTSTKIAVFEKSKEIYKETLLHTTEELKRFSKVSEELPYRKALILESLKKSNISLDNISAIAGRGGLLRPLEGGTYFINDLMLTDLKNAVCGEHASNLGVLLAKTLGDEWCIPSFTVDPVATDEFMDISRITGISDLSYASWIHALNHKAVCRELAESMGKRYEDLNLIVAHLGSGISVAAHLKGRMIDGSGGRTNGPFSPERSGSLPTYPLVLLCYSGKYSKEEMVEKISSRAGFYDYLGTKDMQKIEERALQGEDVRAKQILDAFIYQLSKEICSYGASLMGEVDGVILTGGIAHSKYICSEISARVDYLAPITVIPGEHEMRALAQGAFRVLCGLEKAKEYGE